LVLSGLGFHRVSRALSVTGLKAKMAFFGRKKTTPPMGITGK
jgi:hypothetical protein